MALYKWSKRSLEDLGKAGYKIIPCDSAEEVEELKVRLKQNKLCAQPGYIVNKENKTIYFVLTKERKGKKENK